MNKLSPAQVGRAAELRFAMLVIVGSRGEIELFPPLADDERRDFEIHRRYDFETTLSVQVKAVTVIRRDGTIFVKTLHGPRRPTDPGYWYFVARLDINAVDFTEPMFLIPSAALRRGNHLRPYIYVSMAKNSRDRWVRHRVMRSELGKRLLAILDELAARDRRGAA